VADHTAPEITLGKGPLALKLRGSGAINAAGWTVKLILIARDAGILVLYASASYALFKAPESFWLALARWIG
jgi:hypothetical protein